MNVVDSKAEIPYSTQLLLVNMNKNLTRDMVENVSIIIPINAMYIPDPQTPVDKYTLLLNVINIVATRELKACSPRNVEKIGNVILESLAGKSIKFINSASGILLIKWINHDIIIKHKKLTLKL